MNASIRLAVGILAAAIGSNASALVVTTTNDGNALASNILGSGISISNVTFTGSSNSAGTFTGGAASGIGIDSGILLTSGNASLAVGPNEDDGATGDNGLAGDSDLNALIPGYSTHDATILQFDFTSNGGNVFFNYVFGSEEYNEYIGSAYNDVFGFFLDGTNIALVPGTSTPVSINNVNCGADGLGGPNCALFNDNDPSNGVPTPYDIQYDGFTDVLTASFVGLGAGTHHIKLAIADAGDFILDSGVFIEGGSFSDTPSVPEPAGLALLGIGLLGMGLARKGRKV